MKLVKFRIRNFRCFRELTEIPIHNLTILIGENDSGKSSILKGLEYLLTKSVPSDEEYCEIGAYNTNELFLEGEFAFQGQIPNDLKKYVIDNKITIRKIFKRGEQLILNIFFDRLQDIDLENFENLQAGPMQNLLAKYNLPAQPNQNLRKESIHQYIIENEDQLPKIRGYYEVPINHIQNYLPLFEYYSSNDYGNPKSLVYKTLFGVYRNQFYNEEGKLKTKSLKSLKNRLEEKMNLQIQNNLLQKIKKYNENVVSVKGDFSIDFARGFSLDDLCLDEGQGFKLIEQKGEGSKKRLFLSILEWDKEVQNSLSHQHMIRAYDEPDTNLHFEAQRKMFYAIKDTSENEDSNIQNLIATHSISMIDRAPASSINHIKNINGEGTIEFLTTNNDNDVKKFLEEVSEISGIKNSSIFYEKCFLIVEGDSEENAIPKLYKKYFNRSLIEDGVVIINIESNGSWKNFLKLLNSNKSNITVMLLDQDTQNPNCGAKITPAKLTEIGFDNNFLQNNIFFAGNQEFEDLFPDKLIRDLFNLFYPRPTKGKWTLGHIRTLRNKYEKISKGFEEYSLKYIAHHHKRYRKPEFASEMANLLTKNHIAQIPVLINIFNKIKNILGE